MAGAQGRPTRGEPTERFSVATESERKDINTSMPAKVVSYDPVKQTAKFKPIGKTVQNGKSVEYPELPEVPVNLQRSGGIAMTFPVKAGDYYQLTFAQSSLDHYMKDGSSKKPVSGRMHDLSDATATPMAHPENARLPNYQNDRVSIRNNDGTARISLTDAGKIELKGLNGENVMQILADLIQIVHDHTNQGYVVDVGFKASLTALQARLTTIKA